MSWFKGLAACAAVLWSMSAGAAEYPAPKTGEYVIRDFKFHTGETMAELKLGYTTVGEPTGQPVLVLHGTTGNAGTMLTPNFAGELFGAGQPLDATKYFIIIPDSLGHGKSTKPSDGLRTKFPKYNYDDMVDAQYRLVKEGLGIKRAAADHRQLDGRHACVDVGRRSIPTSWTRWCRWRRSRPRWRPQLDDAPPAGRDDPQDPEYDNGNYTTQPRIR